MDEARAAQNAFRRFLDAAQTCPAHTVVLFTPATYMLRMRMARRGEVGPGDACEVLLRTEPITVMLSLVIEVRIRRSAHRLWLAYF